jgi:hypothetical protein
MLTRIDTLGHDDRQVEAARREQGEDVREVDKGNNDVGVPGAKKGSGVPSPTKVPRHDSYDASGALGRFDDESFDSRWNRDVVGRRRPEGGEHDLVAPRL